MKTILKWPEFEKVVKCSGCGCEYDFEIEDIESVFHDTSDRTLLYYSYVECPICKLKHIIEFKPKTKEDK